MPFTCLTVMTKHIHSAGEALSQQIMAPINREGGQRCRQHQNHLTTPTHQATKTLSSKRPTATHRNKTTTRATSATPLPSSRSANPRTTRCATWTHTTSNSDHPKLQATCHNKTTTQTTSATPLSSSRSANQAPRLYHLAEAQIIVQINQPWIKTPAPKTSRESKTIATVFKQRCCSV